MSKTDHTDPALDPDLIAYVDGALSAEKMAEVEARLAHDPEARNAVAQWRHFDNLIHTAASDADTRPANLQIAALERKLAGRLQRRRWRTLLMGPGLRNIAAGAVLFAAGWWTHGALAPGSGTSGSAFPAYVKSTVAGHAAYQFARAERAEFSGNDMTTAVAWLSEQMQQQIESPKLERLGYTVESARLIQQDDRPVALFYYRNPENQRVTVSISPRRASEPGYSLQLTRTEDGQLAYWSDSDLHYAVVGGADVADITTLAAAVR